MTRHDSQSPVTRAGEALTTSPYVNREEHERQSHLGMHLFDEQCPFCFFDQFDPETRAAISSSDDTTPQSHVGSSATENRHESATPVVTQDGERLEPRYGAAGPTDGGMLEHDAWHAAHPGERCPDCLDSFEAEP